MSPLTEPTRIILAQGYTRPDDADAVAYITAVEAADGQPLETEVRMAINTFVKGCKADGIWDAIKASCILAGARTLSGALVPLKGPAPTNFNFVSGDYSRETGLLGNGSTKYLDSNQNNNASPQNSTHLGVYATVAATTDSSSSYIGAGTTNAGDSSIFRLVSNGSLGARVKCATFSGNQQPGSSTGFIGASRGLAASFVLRAANESRTISIPSDGNTNANVEVFRRTAEPVSTSNARLAFYSIGESLDLALFDARVTDLINKFAEVIP